MLRIAVINDGRKVLPFSMEAMASVFELNQDKYESNIRDTGEAYRVSDLINNQNAFYCADYPTDPEDNDLSEKRIQHLVCGQIDESLVYALEKIRIYVTPDVYEDMKDFPRGALSGCFYKYTCSSNDKPDAAELKAYIDILGPEAMELEYGYRHFGFELTDEEKLYLLDKWVANSGQWCYFDTFIKLFDVQIDLKRAVRYAWYFSRKCAQNKDIRIKDIYEVQSDDLFHLQLLTNHIDRKCEKEFLGEALIMAVKYRLILFAEFLMDQRADINYCNGIKESVDLYENRINDLTLISYLEYYRENGKKPDVDTFSYFKDIQGVRVYSPELRKEETI